MTGWKRLDAPKMAFLFSTMLLTYYALKHQTEPGRGTLAATTVLPLMLPILLLSGERKALLFFLICGLFYLVHAKFFIRPNSWLAILGAMAIAMLLAPSILEIPYVEKQVESILAPISTAQMQIYSSSEYFAESLSNAQRVFATKIGFELLLRSPITGVGTNAYQEIVRARFSYLPPVMMSSIHSEFLRVLVENGVVGLLLFCLPLIRVVSFILVSKARIMLPLGWKGCVLFVAGSLILISMESSGTKLLVLYVLAGILPDL
jgi:O-Antigen ligase